MLDTRRTLVVQIADCTTSDDGYRRGTPLPNFGSKLVLESTETFVLDAAVSLYNRDVKSHRPHYVVDPRACTIAQTLDSRYSVIGDFHPTAPHRTSRCIFVAIVKESAIGLNEQESVDLGRLLRFLCEKEGVSKVVTKVPMGEKLGFNTLKELEGIVSWHAFPGSDEATTPGPINWEKLNEGLLDTVLADPIVEDAPELPTKEETPMPQLESLKVTELKQLAAGMGLSYSGLKKAELVELVKDAVLSGQMPGSVVTKSE